MKAHGANSMYMNQGLSYIAPLLASQATGSALTSKRQAALWKLKGNIRDFGGSSLHQRKTAYVHLEDDAALFQIADKVSRQQRLEQESKLQTKEQERLVKCSIAFPSQFDGSLRRG